MQATDQGTREPGRRRYQAIPRTLTFLTRAHPQTGVQEVLLIRGAASKRLWAGRYNGLGGHVEADEDLLAAARREVAEETGQAPGDLTLRGVVNIDTGADEQGPRPGVLVFVFTGVGSDAPLHTTAEGEPAWIPLADLSAYPLVDDLFELIPRALTGPFFYGHYQPGPDGVLIYHFST
jgi:8-oxo-dGTP diphosphatase